VGVTGQAVSDDDVRKAQLEGPDEQQQEGPDEPDEEQQEDREPDRPEEDPHDESDEPTDQAPDGPEDDEPDEPSLPEDDEPDEAADQQPEEPAEPDAYEPVTRDQAPELEQERPDEPGAPPTVAAPTVSVPTRTPAPPTVSVPTRTPAPPTVPIILGRGTAPPAPVAPVTPAPPVAPTRPITRLTPAEIARAQRYPITAPAAGLVLLAALTPLHGLWAAQLVLVALLLVLPGVLLLRALRVPGESVAAHPVYVPAASLLVLLCSGLAVDLIGPLAGIAEPLRAAPLLFGLEIIGMALLIAGLTAPPTTRIAWGGVSNPLRTGLPLLLPLLSAWGALRLNAGHSARVADVAIAVVLLATLAAFLFAPRCGNALLVTVVFALGLAMMWSFSLRGDLVYGFDISTEYYSLEQTVTAGIWHVSHPNDAYGAMLSVTVLPAEIHALTGIPALLVFKVVYPLVGALFPVAVFNLARRVLSPRWAFMAAALVLMQQTLFQQMPALARQEVATLLFAALLLVVLDGAQSWPTRWTFVALLSLGVVVSHYSTAYLAITLLAIAVVFQLVASVFRQVPRVTGAVLIALVVSVGGTTVWYSALTHSTSNLEQFVQQAKGQGINLLPNQGSNLLATWLQGESEQQLTPAQYEHYLSEYYKQTYSFIKPLPDAGQAQYALKEAASQTPPVNAPRASSALDTLSLVIQQLLNVLAGICALVLALQRRAPVIVRHIGVLGLAGMVILVLTRLSGTIAQEYNPERAFLQMTIVLAIGICWSCQRIGERWKVTRPALLAVGAATFAAFFISSSGMSGALFGGGTPANLANSGPDYQEFVKHTTDLSAASWILQAAPAGQFIYADNYAQLILDSLAGTRPGVFDAITPETLDQHAWVYATSTNLQDNIVRSLSQNNASSYQFPSRFLGSNYDLVYTNGNSEVFHR
jgi:uncharacterized membrane protein